MKKLFIFLFVAILVTSIKAQSDGWKTIYPGHLLNSGETKLIVKQNCLYIFNSNYSSLLRSLDRGLTWDSMVIPSDSTNHEYTDITFVNDSVGYLTGYDGSLFENGIESVVKKTSDRGLTWQTVKNGIINNSILTHIHFFTKDEGIAFGTANMETHQFRTNDGGLNWHEVPYVGLSLHQVNYSSFTNNVGFTTGIGDYLHIAVSNDRGASWETKHFHNYSNPTGIKFFDDQNGIVVVDKSVFITNDGAKTFFEKNDLPTNDLIKSFDMLDMQRGFFSTLHEIYYTNDAGHTWTLSYSDPNVMIRDLKIEGNDVFATTHLNNKILKLDIAQLTTGITNSVVDRGAINLFPNPSTDKVFITSPQNEKLLSASIINQLGQVVLKQNLTQQKMIEVNDLTPGIYFVEINSETEKYTQKLIIQNK